MSVSRDDVLRTAALARLAVSEDRVDAVAAELNGILAHMDVLQQVTLHHSESTDSRGPSLREDNVSPIPLAHSRESFAPFMRDGFFLVPRLGTHEGSGSAGE